MRKPDSQAQYLSRAPTGRGETMGEACLATSTDEFLKACKEFVGKYYQIANTRPDLLYRLYNADSTLSVAETIRGKRKNISASASNQHEIRYLLSVIFESLQTTVINISYQHSASDHLLLMVNGTLKRGVSRPAHFFSQTFLVKAVKGRFAIASDVLQIYSHNLKGHLLGDLQTRLDGSDAPLDTLYPKIVDTKIRSKVCMTIPEPEAADEVTSLFVLSNERPCASTQLETIMRKESEATKEQRLETDTAREAAPDVFRTEGWDEFCKDRPRGGEDFSEVLSGPPVKIEKSHGSQGVFVNASREHRHRGRMTEENADELFLPCFGEEEKHQRIETEVAEDYEWQSQPSEPQPSNGVFLRLFGFQPIPEGPPLEWDLSQDALLTQIRTYQDVVDRQRMPVSSRRTRSAHSQVDWYHRTVYLDNLPVDAHPDSLRRAFETMFGEIEEENGIILVSGQMSSIAYVVFKTLEAAQAVGLADSWINGSKIVIQKYSKPFADIHSDIDTNA